MDFFKGYLEAMKQAVEEDGVDMRSYFAYVKY